jgi:hypothetical protein
MVEAALLFFVLLLAVGVRGCWVVGWAAADDDGVLVVEAAALSLSSD